MSLRDFFPSAMTDEWKPDTAIGFERSCQVSRKENHNNKLQTETRMKSLVISLEAGTDLSLELTLGGVYTQTKNHPQPQTTTDKAAAAEKRPVELEAHNINKRNKPKVMTMRGSTISLELTLGFNKPNCCTASNSKKREKIHDSSSGSASASSTVTSSSANCITNKRIKVDKEKEKKEGGIINSTTSPSPWRIRKKLKESDLNGLSRLLLQREWVESHVYPLWNPDQLARIKEDEGLPVTVLDCDTDTRHQLVYKQWSSSGANVLMSRWISDFVKRRRLKVDDEIGLYWDQHTSEFKFSLLNPAPRIQVQQP